MQRAVQLIVCGYAIGAGLGGVAARGQAYPTPVRASWREDPATTAVISWDTPVAARGTVRYGTTTNYTTTVHDGGGVHRHVIPLRGLIPGTRYFYEATATDGFAQSASFQTAPAPDQPLHFVFHGDLQGGIDEPGAQGVVDRIVQENPQWVQHLGDMAEEAFSDSGFETWNVFFRICSNELARSVFMPMMGNHDAAPGSDYARGLYHRLFALPNPSTGEGYYSHAVGPVRFIALNTEIPAADQNDWLAHELQAAANDPGNIWTIVQCHRPPYSWGERSGDAGCRDNWMPILTRYEADWVVSGHSHNYQRMVPIRGVRYLVAGGGGGKLYWTAPGEPAHAFATTCYHYVSCHVTGDVMQVRGIRSDGLVFDREVATNRRQVRVAPAFPLRGQMATVSYRATEGPLAGANPVHIHIGQDAFTNAFDSAPMTWNASRQRWEYEFMVPASATERVAFAFFDGADIWHNNYGYDWQALLDRASVWPAPPGAGSNAVLRYEADLGPMPATASVAAWISFNAERFPAAGPVAMSNIAGSHWECSVAVPAHAQSMTVHFQGDWGFWDDNAKRHWTFPVAGATSRAWPPAPVAVHGSPELTLNPPGDSPNNIGDNFDLVPEGPPLRVLDGPRGFGDFGSIWVNVDATNLYLGGHGLNLGGSNNVMALFVGVDTLTDNAWNLWHKSGLPNALDFLHNVRFTEPMDVAILLGDQYADDPVYPTFTYGGYDFGQGIFYIGTNSGSFGHLTAAKLSQFHGTGTEPCDTPGDALQRQTKRWEAALPWSALNAPGPEGVAHLFVCGVIASATVNAQDRYLSRAVLGQSVWGRRDNYRQYAFNTIYLEPQRVNLLHADLHGDGLTNGWRLEHFGTPDGPPADEDSDADGQDNRAEEIAGTRPLDPDSQFEVATEPGPGEVPGMLTWPFAAGRIYDVYHTPDLRQPFEWQAAVENTNRWPVAAPGFFRLRVRKLFPPG